MTLLEFCDETNSELIIKRANFLKKGAYFYVKVRGIEIYEEDVDISESSCKIGAVRGKDINKLLYRLCDKLSGKLVLYGWNEKIHTGKVEKGDLSILGVW